MWFVSECFDIDPNRWQKGTQAPTAATLRAKRSEGNTLEEDKGHAREQRTSQGIGDEDEGSSLTALLRPALSRPPARPHLSPHLQGLEYIKGRGRTRTDATVPGSANAHSGTVS